MIFTVPFKPERVCTACLSDILTTTYASREGDPYCEPCAPRFGDVAEGIDCPACSVLCNCQPGDKGCPHFLCQAYAVGGIIPSPCPTGYATCPGAPARILETRENALAIKMLFAGAVSPRMRAKVFGGEDE